MIATILNSVRGTLPQKSLELLMHFACKVPSGGFILDLNCGEGQSTIGMGVALDAKGRADVTIVAADTHIINPVTEKPYQEGTVMRFLENTRRFGVHSRTIPIIASAIPVGTILGKRSANLIIVQSPATVHGLFHEDAFSQSLEVAKEATRKASTIIACCPHSVNEEMFNTLIDRHFTSKYVRVVDNPNIKVFECA